jgi:hypothetical protein
MGTTEYFYQIQNNGNSEKEHFSIVLSFDYVLVIITIGMILGHITTIYL